MRTEMDDYTFLFDGPGSTAVLTDDVCNDRVRQ
jgi:hypothetical protein